MHALQPEFRYNRWNLLSSTWYTMLAARYLIKEVLSAFLGVLVILVLISISNQVVRMLSEVAAGHLSLNTFFKIILLYLPYLLSYTLPLATLLSVLIAYGRLYAEHEMTAFFSNGLTKSHFMSINLTLILSIAMCTAAMSLWVTPYTKKIRREIMAASDSYASVFQRLTAKNMLEIPDDKGVIYVESLHGNHAKNLFIAMKNQSRARKAPFNHWDVIVAESGSNLPKDTNPYPGAQYYVLHDGYIFHERTPTGSSAPVEAEMMFFKSYGVRHPDGPEEEHSNRTASTAQLYHDSARHLEARAELQWRISQPITVILLGWLGLLLSKVAPRQARFSRVFPGILIYVIYMNALMVARNKLQNQLSEGMYWPHVVLAGILLLGSFYQSPLYQRLINIQRKPNAH